MEITMTVLSNAVPTLHNNKNTTPANLTKGSVETTQKIKRLVAFVANLFVKKEEKPITEMGLRRAIAKSRRCSCSSGTCRECERIMKDVSSF